MTASDSRRVRNLADSLAGRVDPERDARQVRLHVAHFGLWATAKNASIVGVILGVVTILAAFIGWTAFSNAGGLQSIDKIFSGGSTGSGLSTLTAILNEKSVMAAAAVLAVLQVVGSIILSVVAALAYNASAPLTGGLLFGFEANRRRPD